MAISTFRRCGTGLLALGLVVIVDLLHEKFDPQAKLITSFEPENSQIFVDEERLSALGLTLRDLAHFLESQPFLFAVFTADDVRLAADAAK